MNHAKAPALGAPGGSLRGQIALREALPIEGSISRRQADLGGSEPTISDELLNAWRSDVRCVECGERVAAAADAALLVGPNRVAHRERCFVPALLRANPLLKLLAARMPAQEVTTTPPVPSRAPDVHDSRAERRARGGQDG